MGGVLKYQVVTPQLQEEIFSAVRERRTVHFTAILVDTLDSCPLDDFDVRVESIQAEPTMTFDVVDTNRGWWFRIRSSDVGPMWFEVVV